MKSLRLMQERVESRSMLKQTSPLEQICHYPFIEFFMLKEIQQAILENLGTKIFLSVMGNLKSH